jgi:predicted phosphodiesterase
VKAPPAVSIAVDDGLIPVLLISDAHLNPEGLDFARALQAATHARAVLDAGDTTSYGVAGEACVVAPIIRSFPVPYVWVRGNHDSAGFERTMRSIGSVTVLDGNETTVAGISVFGVGDPSFTPRRPSAREAMAEDATRVRETIATTMSQAASTVPDVVLVHDCRMAESDDPATPGVAGIAPLVACGHLHQYAEANVDGTTVLHTGTVGAGGLNAFGTGQLQDFDAQVLFFSPDQPHRLVRYFDVNGAGGTPATFVEHEPVAAPVTGGLR